MKLPNTKTLLAIIAALAALIGAITGLVGALEGGSRPSPTPQMVNGHQTANQKAQKAAQAATVLSKVAAPHSRAFRAQTCDKLPTGFGRLGVCSSAPADRHAHVPLGATAGNVQLAAYVTGSTVRGVVGIDTSHWDHCGGYLRGPAFWAVAVGDGTYVDPCAGPLYHALRAAGLPRTTYYFVRQYLSPVWSADHYAQLIRQMGANDSLVPVDDAEAITSCAWIHAFDNELRAQLHLARVFDYSSPGLWPGCSDARSLAYVAGYGPIGQRLAGLPGWVMQQFTDGQVGYQPHCLAVCGDVDVLPGSLAQLLAVASVGPPPPTPPTNSQTAECGTLRYWRSHGYGGRPDTGDLRNSLLANFVGCPDHTAVHYRRGPNPPQPSPAEFRMCRELLWWRAHGRPGDQRAHEQGDRASLTARNVTCDGPAPLIARHR